MAIITGTSGPDKLNGFAAADEISGLGGSDTLNGNGGGDTLLGGGGNDSLVGGSGADSLVGAAGVDTLDGGSGNDTYVIDASDVLTDSGGIDGVRAAFDYTLLSGFENLVLAGNAAIDGMGNSAANRIAGNNAGNQLRGLGGDDTLNGAGGNDTLPGSNGNDSLSGGTGADSLVGGAGVDTLNGGSGNDVYAIDASDLLIDGNGIDSVRAAFSYTLLSGFENLVLGGGAAINGTGNNGANAITGNNAVNLLSGGSGNDTLTGAGGNDVLNGGLGTDTAVYTGNFAAYTITNLGSGQLRVATTVTADGTDTIRNFEILEFANGTFSNGVFTPFGDPTNTAPLATADFYAATEDTALVVIAASGVLGNDEDPDADALTVASFDAVSAQGGSVALNPNGSFTYTPVLNFNGSDSFFYTIADGRGGLATTKVTVNVAAVNDDPVANNNSYTGTQDTALVVNAASGVLANDQDADGNTLTIASFDAASLQGGTVAMNSNGSFTYTPPAGFTGTDSFSYIATDSISQDAATVNLTVNSAGSGPVLLLGTAGHDLLDVRNAAGAYEIRGLAGGDVIYGSAFGDLIVGGTGTDQMFGNGGNDLFLLEGVDPNNYDIIHGGSGSDTILGSAGNDVFAFGTSYISSIEWIDGGGGNDVIRGPAGVQYWDFSQTTLIGNIEIDAGVGDDQITGSTGNDRIIGGAGNDVLNGGLGTDTAVYTGNFAAYTITNLGSGQLRVATTVAADGTNTIRNFEILEFANGTFSNGVFTPSAAQPPTSSFDTIIANLPEGEWVKLNVNSFQSVWTPFNQQPHLATSAPPKSIIEAWGAATWDSNQDEYIIWGGGHANYEGNEVYTWSAATLQWERASLPSAIVQIAGAQYETVDGYENSPISSHAYDNLEFLEVADRMINFGGAAAHTGAGFVETNGTTQTGPYLWDPSKADPNKVGGLTGSQVNPSQFPGVVGGEMWENRDTWSAATPRPGTMVNGTTDYALIDGVDVVFVNDSSQRLFKYTIPDVNDPSQDTWELVGTLWDSYSGTGAGAYDPDHNIYVRTSLTEFTFWDLDNAGPTNRNISFIPSDPSGEFNLSNKWGMEYDPVREQFVLWQGDASIWYLKPPETLGAAGWTLEEAPAPTMAAPAVPALFHGVLGKWDYVESHDVFIGVTDPFSGDIWAYKPGDWML